MRRACAVVIIACVACVVATHRLTVTGRDLHRSLATLRAQGSATVDAEVRDDDVVSHAPETIAFDQSVGFAGKPHTIRELARSCPDAPPFAEDAVSGRDCELVRHRDDAYAVRSWATRSVGRAVRYTIAGGVLVAAFGAFTCEAVCKSGTPAKEASDITLGVLAVGLVGGIVWAIVSCSGHWGDPGCRD